MIGYSYQVSDDNSNTDLSMSLYFVVSVNGHCLVVYVHISECQDSCIRLNPYYK